MTSWVIQIDGWDPVANAAVTLRAASEDDDRICHLNGQLWWPAIARLPVLSYDFFGGNYDAGRIETPSGAFVLSVDPFPNLPRYTLGGARFRLWGGNPGDAWGSWVLRFDGVVVAQPSISDGLARIDFKVDDRWADAPLLTTYAGSGGSEGLAEHLGQPKPLAFGAPRFAGGTMINVADNIVQLHAAGAIEEVEVAFEALGRFSAPVADYANYGALLAASVPAGDWATALSAGLVKFGAPPTGRLSFHLKGDNTDGHSQKPGEIISRIATLSGGTGKIATSTLTALDTARPWNVSLALTEQVTARELIQRVAASVNAVAGISWTGKLWVQPIGIGTPTITLAADGTALPPVGRVEQVGIAAPFWRLAIEAENTWQVHAASEVALVDGPVGSTTATVYLFKRAASAPALPSASITYDFTDGSATGITNGWSQTTPAADGNPLWVTTAFAIDTATTATISAGDWAPVAIQAQDGAPGDDGLNTATVFLYQRAASTPSVPSTTATYTFASGVLTGHNNGWVQAVPAHNGNPLYVTTAAAIGSGSTDAISSGEWGTVRVLAENGAAGSNGLNNATVNLYRRAATTPALPTTTATYTFATGALTGHNNSWTQAVPAADGNPLWVTAATASAASSTDTIAAGEWASAVIMAQDGAGGAAGINAATVFLYQRAASAPSAPSTTATYTFSSGALTGHNNGWGQTVPANDGNPLYVTTATALGTGSTDTISSGEWSAVRVLAEDGADGATGVSTRIVFQRSATIPATPSASSGTPAGWYDTTTAVPAGSGPIWGSTGERASGGTNYTWGTPVRVEAIAATGTGQFVNLSFSVSSTISFSLAPGESKVISGAAALDSPTGSGFAHVQIEHRVAGAGWSASNGVAENYTSTEPVYCEHSVTVTNSGSTVQSYETRGTIVRTNTSSGPQTASTSLLRI